MSVINSIKQINFRQGKYILPAIFYPILLYLGYIAIDFFDIKPVEINTKGETTDHINEKLPDANIKGDGIGDKYTNMVDNYGKIKDESAVQNIERGNENMKEEYSSQYSDAELAAMDKNSKEAQESAERLKQLQEQILQQQAKDERLSDRSGGNTEDEEKTLAELRKALEQARDDAQRHLPEDGGNVDANQRAQAGDASSATGMTAEVEGVKDVNEHAVTEVSEEAKSEEVVKSHKETSDYFNTISTNEPEHKLIRAIVDEEVTAVEGSRVRLRLLDDIDIGERTIKSGSYLYCTMSGFSQQRVKGNVKSILYNDELVKVNLSIYDTDGMEGLYVPKSSFRETTNDIASGTISQNMNLSDGSSTGGSMSRWGMQALQNAYQKAANAIAKNIRKNKVKLKYGTQVYLINSRDKKNNQ